MRRLQQFIVRGGSIGAVFMMRHVRNNIFQALAHVRNSRFRRYTIFTMLQSPAITFPYQTPDIAYKSDEPLHIFWWQALKSC